MLEDLNTGRKGRKSCAKDAKKNEEREKKKEERRNESY
jgi:hypothetical protein